MNLLCSTLNQNTKFQFKWIFDFFFIQLQWYKKISDFFSFNFNDTSWKGYKYIKRWNVESTLKLFLVFSSLLLNQNGYFCASRWTEVLCICSHWIVKNILAHWSQVNVFPLVHFLWCESRSLFLEYVLVQCKHLYRFGGQFDFRCFPKLIWEWNVFLHTLQ